MNPKLFASPRERYLWICVLVVVVAIFASLRLTSRLMEVVVNREVFVNAFIAGFGIVWLVVLTSGLRIRPHGAELALWFGVFAVYLFAFARMGIPERTHLFEYTVVATFVYEALNERSKHVNDLYAPSVLAVALTVKWWVWWTKVYSSLSRIAFLTRRTSDSIRWPQRWPSWGIFVCGGCAPRWHCFAQVNR